MGLTAVSFGLHTCNAVATAVTAVLRPQKELDDALRADHCLPAASPLARVSQKKLPHVTVTDIYMI